MDEANILQPTHIGIIMDGNGRWATSCGMPRAAGHKAGTERIKPVISYCGDNNIKYLTLYAFSTENWKRPKNEVATLMELVSEYLSRETAEMNDRGVKLRFIGDLSSLPKKALESVRKSEEILQNNTRVNVNIALNYGGRAEIIRAAKLCAEEVLRGERSLDELSEEYFSEKLYTSGQPEPDLIIRTAGEQRLSNFLSWQCAYSELYFTDVYWPNFNDKEFDKAIEFYRTRKRKFGGL